MIAAELEREVVGLNYRYARCLDENRLEEWPEFFTDDCRYLIQPRGITGSRDTGCTSRTSGCCATAWCR